MEEQLGRAGLAWRWVSGSDEASVTTSNISNRDA